MSSIQITNEIKQLRKVLLHRPGNELLNLTPRTLGELLFDDIPYLRMAQKEHDEFARVLRENGVEVVYLEDLMTETLNTDPKIREQFIEQYLQEADISQYYDLCRSFLYGIADNYSLVLKTMEGITDSDLGISPSAQVMIVKPMPNLYFTRDSFACIGNGVSLNSMYYETRRRETIYGEYIFRYHPQYSADATVYYDRYQKYHIEGGDIINLNEQTLLIGISERTEINAIKLLADNLFRLDDTHQTVIAMSIPEERASMHLDTVLTQVDYDKFVVHPEILEDYSLYLITRDDPVIRKSELTLQQALEKYMNQPEVMLISCGGDNKIVAEREQWNDASNTLCIRPGTVILYDRNEITNRILNDYGITVLTIPSGELSRGRGGPRCMSMPLIRDL